MASNFFQYTAQLFFVQFDPLQYFSVGFPFRLFKYSMPRTPNSVYYLKNILSSLVTYSNWEQSSVTHDLHQGMY